MDFSSSPDTPFSSRVYLDLKTAAAGETCARCSKGKYEQHRGIEVGQVFYLGTKYSERMNACIQDEQGKKRVLEMGCCGIGVTRTMAAAIEQNYDENGIIWPFAIAPFQVIICPAGRAEEITATAEKIYRELLARGIEVLLDDRRERPGVMFKDADLIGIPLRITVGKKTLADNKVELKLRREKEPRLVPVDQITGATAEIINRETAGNCEAAGYKSRLDT